MMAAACAPQVDTGFSPCSQNFADIFPGDEVWPAYVASTLSNGCFGTIEAAPGVEVEGSLWIFYDQEGSLKLGVDEMVLAGLYLNGSIPFVDYRYCENGSFSGEVETGYGLVSVAGVYRDMQDGQCFNTNAGVQEIAYTGNQVLYGGIYRGKYEELLAEISANRFFD